MYKNKNITIKITGIMKRLSMILSRKSLLTIYKYFDRPLLDYVDIIYDKLYNELFKGKPEAFQFNICLAITVVIRGTSRVYIYKLYKPIFEKNFPKNK